MPPATLEIQIVPLAPNVEPPRRASPRTRSAVPPGYGVQEQCLPFTAAAGLGFVIPSPIRFGHCPTAEVPPGCRAFRSPVPAPAPHTDWVFYVEDDPQCNFVGNAYTFADLPAQRPVLEPGLSFFDREDQQDLFKLHLPYIWRTPPEIDTLFLPPINRAAKIPEVMSGLVETDWYSNPVNMILRKPAHPVHVSPGLEIAQAVFISRRHRTPEIQVAPPHARITREVRKELMDWYARHAEDQSAYKILARSRQGRIES